MDHIVRVLHDGGVGVMPTDTIYGIVACAKNRNAVERVYELKSRSRKRPFLLLISDIDQIKEFGIELTPSQKDLMHGIWHDDGYYKKLIQMCSHASENDLNGRPISVVVPCHDDRYTYLHQGQNSIGFRLVRYDDDRINSVMMRSVIERVGPVIATSANISNQPFAVNIIEAREYFGDLCDFYMESICEVSAQPSVVIALEQNNVSILRA